MTIIDTGGNTDDFFEGLVLIVLLSALLCSLVLVGAFFVGITVKGSTRSDRWFRAGVCAFSSLLAITIAMNAVFGPKRLVPRAFSISSELQVIDAAIVEFRTRFGMDPPSLIHLCEDPDDWASQPQSRRLVKYCWPKFDFSLKRDLNRDGDCIDRLEIDGAECLVFFLGGLSDPDTGHLRGFSKNPADPFVLDDDPRDGPFFEFDFSRFIDNDGDEFAEYADPYSVGKSRTHADPVPYIYLSSYSGTGYAEADVAAVAHISESPLESHYFRGPGYPYLADRHQIISAGRDGLFGDGGLIESRKPAWYEVNPDYGPEFDNVTNFHSGVLGR